MSIQQPARECSARPRTGENAERLARAARQYIEAHYAEKFSLEKVAGALYVNPSYLLRVFKARTGQTLLGYHNFVRCQHAMALLSDPDKTISQAGEEAGFVSSSHFSHIFRKITGSTPSEYRAAHLTLPSP